MTKRVTPATTAIGVITVTLLVAGGTRLFSTTAASAAGTTPVTVGQIAVSPATLPPDGQSSAVVTVTGGQACASGLLSTPTATFSTDGASLFGTSQSGPWTSTLKVNFDNTGNAQTYVHCDVFAWIPIAKPGRPKGGEAQGVRALFAAIRERYDG